jgi:hypothetical protein
MQTCASPHTAPSPPDACTRALRRRGGVWMSISALPDIDRTAVRASPSPSAIGRSYRRHPSAEACGRTGQVGDARGAARPESAGPQREPVVRTGDQREAEARAAVVGVVAAGLERDGRLGQHGAGVARRLHCEPPHHAGAHFKLRERVETVELGGWGNLKTTMRTGMRPHQGAPHNNVDPGGSTEHTPLRPARYWDTFTDIPMHSRRRSGSDIATRGGTGAASWRCFKAAVPCCGAPQ